MLYLRILTKEKLKLITAVIILTFARWNFHVP